MNYRGIVITGTSGSGKSSIVAALQRSDDRFRLVVAVTTRVVRTDDEPGTYEHISEDSFNQLKSNNELQVATEYRGAHYGIRHSDLAEVSALGKIPLAVVTPASESALNGEWQTSSRGDRPRAPQYLSFFVDCDDQVLDARLRDRGEITPEDLKSAQTQRNRDRETRQGCAYVLDNKHIEACVDLIVAMWDYSSSGGVLSARLISMMLRAGTLLEGAQEDKISSASYDLSLGTEYFYGGKIRRLTDDEPILLIEPYDYAIVTSQEYAAFPLDICARFDLAVSLFCQGLILSNGPQVDPGFRGPLFCLLFNTSSSPVLLKQGQHYATLEFHKLVEPSIPYSGPYQHQSMLHYLPSNAARGAINDLKKELDELRGSSERLQSFLLAFVSLVLAMIAILQAF